MTKKEKVVKKPLKEKVVKKPLKVAVVKKNEVSIVGSDGADRQISGFIEQAIQQKLPVETMERLFALQKDVKAELAQEAFVSALANFQASIPIIKKTKAVKNKDNTVRYMYAPIDSVIDQIRKPLAESGLSYTWDSVRENDHIKMICKLTHVMGHSERSSFDIPIVKDGFMSSPQTYATAQSYAKRYTLLNVLGIGTADEDTDAIDSDNNDEPKSQKAQIMFLLKRLGYEGMSNREQVSSAVFDSVGIELKDDNLLEIVKKLTELANQQGL